MNERTVSILLAISVGAAVFSIISNAETGTTIRRDWELSGYKALDRSANAADSIKDIAARELSIGEDNISFGSETCDKVSFQSTDILLEDYLQARFGISPEWLELSSGRARVIRTSCAIVGFSEYVRLTDRRILIFRDGLFLFFRPWVFY